MIKIGTQEILDCRIGGTQVNKVYLGANLVWDFTTMPYNLFIGGVASTLSTASLLATKLGVSSSIITDYTIVGDDIKCVITTPFSIPTLSWQNDTNVTYFLAYGNIITSIGIGNFENFANLELFYCEGNPGFNTVFNGRTIALVCELPELTILSESAFYTNFSSNKSDIFYMPLCVQLGTVPSVNENCFFDIGSGSKIYVDPFLQTCNAGGPDADLVYAVSRGAIVRYVTNFTAPNQITDLSAGTIYSTAVQLNFTTPSTTNAIEYYDVFVDGVFYQRITANAQFIIGLDPVTNYDITVVAVDIFYNKSIVSNSINVTTASVDADASTFITNASISDSTQQTAINNLVVNHKVYGLWTKKKAIYPIVGGTANQHKYNLKNTSTFMLTYTGTVTHSANGMQTSSSYANTQLNLLTEYPGFLNSGCFSFYSRTETPTGDGWNIGVGNTATGNPLWGLAFRRTGTNDIHFDKGDISSNGRLSSTTTDARGLIQGNITASNNSKIFINGVVKVSSTLTASGTPSNGNVYIGAMNPTSGSLLYMNNECAFVSIGDGLTDDELLKEYEIVQIFQTMLGRNV